MCSVSVLQIIIFLHRFLIITFLFLLAENEIIQVIQVIVTLQSHFGHMASLVKSMLNTVWYLKPISSVCQQ